MWVYGVQMILDSDCVSGKRGYPTRKDAKRMQKGQHGALRQLHPYDCPMCAYWHLGHPRRTA